MVTIRIAQKKDAIGILALIQEYFSYTEINEDELLRRIQSPQFIFHCAHEKNQFAGFAEWEIIDAGKKIIRLNAIAVFPNYHEKGFASKLLKIGEEDAKSRGMKKLTLIVGENNQPAKKLYEKNGLTFARPNLKKIDGQKSEIWEKSL